MSSGGGTGQLQVLLGHTKAEDEANARVRDKGGLDENMIYLRALF
jgi:hypothetical protein